MLIKKRVYSLLIISGNHSNTISLLDLQNNISKVKYCSKSYLLRSQNFDRFRKVAVHYLMSILMYAHKQVAKFYRKYTFLQNTHDDYFWK